MSSQRTLVTVPYIARGGGISHYYEAVAPHVDGVTILRIGAPSEDQNRYARLIRAVFDNVRLGVAIARLRPDLVHVNPTLNRRCLLRDGLSVIVARAFRRQVVVFFRGWDPETEMRLNGLLLSLFRSVFFRADACVVLYSGFRTQLKKWGYRGPIHVFTTVVSDDCLDASSVTTIRERCRTHRPLRLLFMARLVKGKGIYETIEAYAQVRQKIPGLDIVIAGTGPEETGARAAAQANGIPASAFVGEARDKEKVTTLLTSDIYVLPTVTEGMPNAVLEALALGLTVITCPVGGLQDFFRDGEFGLLADDLSPELLSNLIVRAAQDADFREKVGIRGHDFARRHFSAALSGQRLTHVYEEVRARRHEARGEMGDYIWYEAETAGAPPLFD